VTRAEQIDVAVPATPFDQTVAETDSAALPALETGVEDINAPGTEAEDNLAGLASEVDGEAVSNPDISDQVVNEMAIDGPSVSGPQIEAAAEPTMLEQLTSEAQAGSSSAALILGLNYLNDDGVVESESEAFRWLRLAAEQGEPVAQSRLGSMFERGLGVAADPREAALWYEQAARSGNVRAMHNLGIAHADGAGVEENFGEAARLFRNAADLGLADSQFNLAILYSSGTGVPTSLSEAYKWYLIAGAQGDNEAQMRAEALAAELPQNERDTAEVAAAAFTPLAPNGPANTSPTLAQIQ
jgi:localization factor PodJL